MANGNKSFYFQEATARQLELIALATGESKGAILRRLIAAEAQELTILFQMDKLAKKTINAQAENGETNE